MSVTFTNKDDPTITTSILPRGMIIPFSGTKIPKSWALCDGTMGTQDLRGRFILGGTSGNSVPNLTKTNSISDYGSTPFPKGGIIQDLSQGHFPNDRNQLYVGSTGGIANQVLTTNELPSHSHTYTNSIANNSNRHHEMTPDSDDGDIVIQMDNNFGLPNSNTSTTGETQGHNNMPPYYVVQYIMKL